MRAEFNNLVETMNRYDLYQKDDEVGMALTELEQKIAEVEKRLKIVDKTAREIESAISNYTQSVDNNEAFKMSVDNHDVVLRGSHDIMIATDLGDDEPIKNDWYGMFTPIDNEPYLTLGSSWGSITCNKKGDIVEVVGDEFIDGERNYLHDIESIDVAEYLKFLKDNNIEFYDEADILAVGFRRKNGEYDRADKRWREEMYLGITEEEVKNEPPTELCKTPQTHEFVKDIIAKLKVIDVDGETMEYILEQVGMSDQMLRQLARKDPKETMEIIAE